MTRNSTIAVDYPGRPWNGIAPGTSTSWLSPVKQLEGLCRLTSIDALHRWAIGPRSMPTIRPVLPPGA